jgi:amino acid adenylation domain-containing protein
MIESEQNAYTLSHATRFIPIHQRITEQGLGRAKEAVLLHSSGSLSWADLEESSNCLAHQLVVSGVGAEIRVGVHVSRSPRMIIAMLAVLKAGGAFVPLDPDYPSARLVYMLRDAGVSHLLTERGLASGLLDIESLSVVYLEDIDKGYPSTAPGVIIHPEQSAYVIYTSGSTGHPKGVTVGHEALAAHCKAIGLCYELSSADRVLHFASINFDLAHEYWLMPLSYGASLLITDRSLWGAQEMCEQLVDYGVTVAAFPPSYLLQLTQVVQERTMKLPLRVLAFGGEALSSSHFKHVRAAFSPATLINGYGPTETVISPMLWITTPKSESSSWQGGPYLPIGTVVGARTAYVLDAWLNPLPVGVAGELYLGGALLARGYHERAGLTAERFIPDPWGVGGRLYRTGDRACWRSDGSVAYLGRVDKQVKLRGQRIELGEIEAQLLACGGVREAVVVLQGEGAQARLVAYVVADCSPFDFLEVQQQLAQRLPAVMLPTQWVELSRLPVNGSGKLDRHALPLPMPQGDSRPYRAPQSATELSLAAIWAEVLRVERVGLDDHFFMLGGHSLSVMQVCARIQKQMGLMVPLRTLFYAPLFSVFAQHVAGECSNISTVEPALIPHHDPEHAIPLSFAQQSLWFLWQLAPYDPGYTIFTALRCHGKLDSSILQRCIDALITRHTSLRTTFSINAQGQLQQNIDAPTSVLIREDDFSHRPLTARLVVAQRVAEEESQRPFDLKHGPLIRLRLLHLSSEDHVMLLSIHHIAADGWSMGIIFKELMAIYRAELMGSTVDSTLELPALSISYADYASWQQRSGIEQTGSLTYWRTQLSDLPQLPLPPAQTSFGRTPSLRGKQLLFSLDPVLLENARAFTQQQGVTLAMLLQTIFHAALYRYTGQTDQCIGTLLSNREQLATESLVGLFLNALPLRVHIDPRQSLIGLLNKVKDTVLGAQTHADVPFIQLVEILRPPRSAGRNPLFQVLYNFLPPNSSVLTLPELQIDDFSVPRNTLVFDLELDLAEDAQGQVRGALSYAIERVDAAFAHALWEDYPHLLAALLNAPHAPLVTLIQAVAPVTMTVTKPQEIIPHHAVLEAQLAAIFVETLGLSTTLTRDDNFFALGMRSLDCFVVVENARQQGITLCINDLFLYQTPAELAAALAVSSVALTSPI